MSAWLPFFASLTQLVIVLYGGYLVMEGDMSCRRLGLLFRLSLNVVSAHKNGRFFGHASSASSGRVR